MPKNINSYQKVSHDIKNAIYVDKEPQKVLSMQDPSNPYSYNIALETLYMYRPNIKYIIIESFEKNF
jgi:hypothetical protein